MTTPPVALTIAGSDSGGGAGIQADLRVFAAAGAFGTSVLTAVTAQDTTGVTDVHVVPAGTVAAQLDAVLGDLPPAAVKTGMLATPEIVSLVADRAAGASLRPLVVDPVAASTTGHRLLATEAEAALRDRLVPLADVATPNRAEAALLTGTPTGDVDGAAAAAQALRERGTGVVVVTGGHPDGDEAVDVVAHAGGVDLARAPAVATANDHGTGCAFSAAIAAALADGADPLSAVHRAREVVRDGLIRGAGWKLGRGRGPVAAGFPRPDIV